MLASTMAAKKTKASKARKSAVAKAKPKVRARKAGAKSAAAKAPRKKARAKAPAKPVRAKARAPKKPTARKKPSTPKKLGAPKEPSAPKKARKKTSAPAVHRRDGAGHLDPKYAATLRAISREGRVEDREEAFVGTHTKDDLAEEMGETWVETATTGEDTSQAVFSQDVPEDEGGPFVTTTAGQEFAEGTDASNPQTAKREPFPRT
jgi:hypothetical protein